MVGLVLHNLKTFTVSGIAGECKATHRMGDIYFGIALQEFAAIPPMYKKFVPEDYKDQISNEERSIEFSAIGTGYHNIGNKSGSTSGRLTTFLLNNLNENHNTKSLRSAGFEQPSETIRNLEHFFDFSVFYHLNRSHGICGLEDIQQSQEDLKEIQKIDQLLGIANDGAKDSYDSSML